MNFQLFLRRARLGLVGVGAGLALAPTLFADMPPRPDPPTIAAWNITTVPDGTQYASGATQTVTGWDGITTQSGANGVVVSSGANVTYTAGGPIKLEPGFHATAGSQFHAAVNNDTDGDGLPDWWEIRYSAAGLSPTNAADAATVNADGLTNLQEYNLGRFPGDTAPVQYSETAPIEIRVNGKPATTGAGSVTVTFDGNAYTADFSDGQAGVWARAVGTGYWSNGVFFQYTAALGEAIPLQVSASGMSDYTISVLVPAYAAPGAQSYAPKAIIAGATSKFFGAIRQAELPSSGSTTVTMECDRSYPFGGIDTSEYETRGAFWFGLGGSNSSNSPGVISLGSGNISFVPGPATMQVLGDPALTHYQVQVPAGYVDVVRTYPRITINYYPNVAGGYAQSGGFYDFSGATPVATYYVDGYIQGRSGGITRIAGGVATYLEFEYSSTGSQILDVEEENYGGTTLHVYTYITDYYGTSDYWNWRKIDPATGIAVPRGGLTEGKSHTEIQDTRFGETGPYATTRNPTYVNLTRYLSSTADSQQIGYYESSIVPVGQSRATGNTLVTPGWGTDVAPDVGVSSDSWQVLLTGPTGGQEIIHVPYMTNANGKGGVTTTIYYMNHQIGFSDNLDGQPTIAGGEIKAVVEHVGNDTAVFAGDDYNNGYDPTAVVTTFGYNPDPVDARAVPNASNTMQGTTQLGHSDYTYASFTFNGQPAISTTTVKKASSSVSLTSTVTRYSSRLADITLRGKLISTVNPDGTKVSYAYKTIGTDLMVAILSGKAPTNSGDAGYLATYAGVAIDPVDLDATRSIVTEQLYSAEGLLKSETNYLYNTGGAWVLLNSVTNTYDYLGNLTAKTSDTGRVLYSATYAGFLKTQETSDTGIVQTFTYNDYDELLTATRAGATDPASGNAIAATTTTYAYDGTGRVTTETVSATGATDELVTTHAYDTANRVTSTTAPGGFTTAFAYTLPTSTTGYQIAATLPGGATKIETFYRDGRTASVAGTAGPDVANTYSYDSSTGFFQTVQVVGSGTTRSTTTYADWAGRVDHIDTPTYSGTSTITNHYNSKGQLTSQTTTNGGTNLTPTHLYSYDSFGRLQWECLDANGNGTIDSASDYNVKYHLFAYQTLTAHGETDWYRYETDQIFPYAGTSSGTGRTAFQHYTQVSGLTDAVAAYTLSSDFDYNWTISSTTVDRAHAVVTTTSTVTGSSQSLLQVTLDGLPIKSTNAQGQTTLMTYDALGRLSATDDPRIGTTSVSYVADSVLVANRTNPDGTGTDLVYDNAGRVKSSTDHLTGKTAYFQYDAAGNLQYQWGDTVNPAYFEYNDLNQRTKLHSYRTGTFTGSTLPTAFGSNDDVTTWTYQTTTSLLLSKQDAASHTTSYQYNDLGQISQRTDARGVVTTYTYNAHNLLATVAYTNDSSNTHGLTYTYDRAGRTTAVTDVSGERDFAYYDGGAQGSLAGSAKVQSETLPSFYGGQTITYTYQYGVANRANGPLSDMKLGDGTLYEVAYGYDGVLRPNALTYENQSTNLPYTYTYTTNSNLIATVAQGTSGYWRTNTYRSHNNRFASISQGFGTGTNAGLLTDNLTYDDRNRLTSSQTLGIGYMQAIGRGTQAGVEIDYGYDDRSEVTSSTKYALSLDGNGDPVKGSALTGTGRSYGYDNFANRTSDQNGTYTPNNLNQYTATPWATGLTYDANGNVLNDGPSAYTYDAENRPITVTTAGVTWNFKYDYLGRRIEKSATGHATVRYLYDGWNLIAELDGSGTLGRRFVWGLDATGTTQGAGGVGGLLAIDTGTAQYFPTYDPSYNVVGLYDGSGNIAAAYEYDPFGNLQTVAGSYGASNPFRFSTKYTDETGLVYYGMRYYSPYAGRFINRDPIEEKGGLNLYAFCGNDGIDSYDVLGQVQQYENDLLHVAEMARDKAIRDAKETYRQKNDWDFHQGKYDNQINAAGNQAFHDAAVGADALLKGNVATMSGEASTLKGKLQGAIDAGRFDIAGEIATSYNANKGGNNKQSESQNFSNLAHNTIPDQQASAGASQSLGNFDFVTGASTGASHTGTWVADISPVYLDKTKPMDLPSMWITWTPLSFGTSILVPTPFFGLSVGVHLEANFGLNLNLDSGNASFNFNYQATPLVGVGGGLVGGVGQSIGFSDSAPKRGWSTFMPWTSTHPSQPTHIEGGVVVAGGASGSLDFDPYNPGNASGGLPLPLPAKLSPKVNAGAGIWLAGGIPFASGSYNSGTLFNVSAPSPDAN